MRFHLEANDGDDRVRLYVEHPDGHLVLAGVFDEVGKLPDVVLELERMYQLPALPQKTTTVVKPTNDWLWIALCFVLAGIVIIAPHYFFN